MRKFILTTAAIGSAWAAPSGQEDCSNSEPPHSARCLSEWFLDAGCQSLYAATNTAWRNESDIEQIKQEMSELYQKATEEFAANQDMRRCRPLTKIEKQQQECYEALVANCKDCAIGSSERLTFVNTTCVSQCISDNEEPKEKCPTLAKTIECDSTLQQTCGKCVGQGPFGREQLDEECMKKCFEDNKADIEKACPMPEWLTELNDCKNEVEATCKDCEDAEDPAKCYLDCWEENKAELNQTCPEFFGDVASFIIQVEEQLVQYLQSIAEEVQSGIESVEDLLLAPGQEPSMGGSIQDVINNLFGALAGLLGGLASGIGEMTALPEGQGTGTVTIDPTDVSLPPELASLFGDLFGPQTDSPTTTNPIDEILGAIFPLGGDLPTEAPTPTGAPENFFDQLLGDGTETESPTPAPTSKTASKSTSRPTKTDE